MAALSLIFDILARDKASRAFDDVGDAADRAGKKGGGAGSAISSGMKLAAGALLGGGLIAGFQSLYEAAAASARVTAITEQVIKTTGSAANLTANQVSDLGKAISDKTGIDNTAIQSGANLLLTFTNIKNAAGDGNDIFTQTTQIMTDMSVALGTDASASAIQLGKALNDPIAGVSALTEVGVSFTAQQKEQIKAFVEAGDIMSAQKIILEELGREFGGAAEAAATPLDRLKVTVGNLQEEIGAYLIPVVDKVSTFFMDEFLPAAREVGGVIGDNLIPVFKVLGSVLGDAVEFVGVAAGAFGALPGPVQSAVLAMGAFVLLRGPLTAMIVGITAQLKLFALAMFMGGGVGGFRAAMSGMLTAIGPVTLAVGLLAFAVASFVADQEAVAARMKGASTAGREFNTVLAEQHGRLNSATFQATVLAVETLGLSEAFDDANVSMRTVGEALAGNRVAYDEALEAAKALDEQQLFSQGIWGSTGILMDLVSGKATENADAFRAAAGQAGDYFITIGNVDAGGFGEWAERTRAATDAAGDAAETAALQVSPLVTEIEDAAAAAGAARTQTDLFKTSLDILTGASVSMTEVEVALERSLAAGMTAMEGMNGAVLEGAGDLNEQSTAGQAASDVLHRVRDSGNLLIATMIQQGATTEEVTTADANLRASFIRTAEQMGISTVDAGLLADEILGIPSERTTKINADTTAALTAVGGFQRAIDGLRGKTVTVSVIGSSTARALIQQGNPNAAISIQGGFFGGGYTGPGGKFEPKGVVHGGEFVFTKEETAAAGVPSLRSLAKSLRGYAAGDFVPVNINLDDSDAIASMVAVARQLKMAAAAQKAQSGTAGGGVLGGGWTSIFNAVKAVIPQARANSTYRPGDPGYHGRGKAVDFGFGSGPGGAGSAGLASINRLLHDKYGRSLAELIYDGIGDDRPDLKNGRPLNYGAATSSQHRNHVHAAVYDGGGLLPPGFSMAYNGTGAAETVRSAAQERALAPNVQVRVFIGEQELTHLVRVESENVVIGALTGATDRGRYNG